MNDLLTSPWFSGLDTASQATVAVLAILASGTVLATWTAVAWKGVRWWRGKPQSAELSATGQRFLRLFADNDWSIERNEKDKTLELIHRSNSYNVIFHDNLTPKKFEAHNVDVTGSFGNNDAVSKAAWQCLDRILADAPSTGSGRSSGNMKFEKPDTTTLSKK